MVVDRRKIKRPAPIRTSIKFNPLYTSDKRYLLLTGGRGSLKSTTVLDYLARLTYEANIGVMLSRYTMESAEVSIIPEFKKTLSRLGVLSHFRITKKEAINKKTGSFIRFAGLKSSSKAETGRLKSIQGITHWVIEEGEDFTDEKTFNDIDRSIRSTVKPNQVIIIMNPTTKEHWIYKRFIEESFRTVKMYGFDIQISTHPDCEHIHVTYHTARKLGYLDAGWLRGVDNSLAKLKKALKQNRDPSKRKEIIHTSEYYLTYIGGWLLFSENAIFKNWSVGEFDESLPTAYGIDYGFKDPLSMVKIAVDQKNMKLYVHQEIYAPYIKDVPEAMHERGIPMKAMIVADTNEPRTTIKIFEAGWEGISKAHKYSGSVVAEIREMQQFEIIITPTSKDVIKCFSNYTWKDTQRASAHREVPGHDYSHGPDSVRYPFSKLVLLDAA